MKAPDKTLGPQCIKSCFFPLTAPPPPPPPPHFQHSQTFLLTSFITVPCFSLEQTELWGSSPLPHHPSPTNGALNESQGVVCEKRNCKTTNSRKPRLPKNGKEHTISPCLLKSNCAFYRPLDSSGLLGNTLTPYHPERRQCSLKGSGPEEWRVETHKGGGHKTEGDSLGSAGFYLL